MPKLKKKQKPIYNKSVVERFLKKVNKTDDCWVWTAAKILSRNVGEYGYFWSGNRLVVAHRVSYEIFIGPIANGLLVCHTCDNTLCVRPDHLFLGTNSDNMKDCIVKNRGNHSSLTEDDISDIRNRKDLDQFGIYKRVARQYNISDVSARKIIKKETWKHVK